MLSRSILLGLLLAGSSGCEREPAGPGADTKLTIAAASSLRELLEATRPAFEAAHPGSTLVFSFDASSSLSRLIEASGAFDAFLSADEANVARVAGRLEPGTTTPFLSNVIVMVARGDLAAPVADPAGLKAVAGKIALAGEAVPAGKYARAILAKRGLLEPLTPRIVSGDNVRATLAIVEAGAADYGFVYRTDAAVAKQAKLVWTAPPEDDPGVVYVAAAVLGAPPLAADYVRWLSSDEFQRAAVERGFLKKPR